MLIISKLWAEPLLVSHKELQVHSKGEAQGQIRKLTSLRVLGSPIMPSTQCLQLRRMILIMH